MITLFLTLLLGAAPEFVFENAQAWRYSEGRQERVPALRARLLNRTADDWAEARFRVRVACADGERAYEVKLWNIAPGSQNVEAVAFDAIGNLRACDGAVTVEFIDGRKLEPERRPSYVVLGFRYHDGNGEPDTHLAGILDHRRFDDSQSATRRVYIGDSGEKLGEFGGATLYCLRVEPGRLGLAGFLLDRHPQSTGPLARFLRFYDLPPGKAVFLGVFDVFRGSGRDTGVTLDPGAAAFEELLAKRPGPLQVRELVRGEGYKPRVQGSFTLEP